MWNPDRVLTKTRQGKDPSCAESGQSGSAWHCETDQVGRRGPWTPCYGAFAVDQPIGGFDAGQGLPLRLLRGRLVGSFEFPVAGLVPGPHHFQTTTDDPRASPEAAEWVRRTEEAPGCHAMLLLAELMRPSAPRCDGTSGQRPTRHGTPGYYYRYSPSSPFPLWEILLTNSHRFVG